LQKRLDEELGDDFIMPSDIKFVDAEYQKAATTERETENRGRDDEDEEDKPETLE
jgi:hypothetical protein